MRTKVRKLMVAGAVIAGIGLASAERAEAALILAGTINGDDYCAVDNNAFLCTGEPESPMLLLQPAPSRWHFSQRVV